MMRHGGEDDCSVACGAILGIMETRGRRTDCQIVNNALFPSPAARRRRSHFIGMTNTSSDCEHAGEMIEGAVGGQKKEDKNSAVAFSDSRTSEILIASTPSRGAEWRDRPSDSA